MGKVCQPVSRSYIDIRIATRPYSFSEYNDGPADIRWLIEVRYRRAVGVEASLPLNYLFRLQRSRSSLELQSLQPQCIGNH